MRIAYLMVAVTCLFMFVFMAGKTELGAARTLLSIAFAGVFFFSLSLFALGFRKAPREAQEKDDYIEELKKDMERGREVKRSKILRRYNLE